MVGVEIKKTVLELYKLNANIFLRLLWISALRPLRMSGLGRLNHQRERAGVWSLDRYFIYAKVGQQNHLFC